MRSRQSDRVTSMERLLVALFLAALVATGPLARAAAAEGPYRGRIVDADTKAPLVGAVVLVYWNREAPGIGHGPVESFLGADEALTDEDGRFVIARNPPRTWIPGTWRSDPQFTIFQPGYGSFPRYFATDPPPPTGRFASLLKVMEHSSVTFELPRLRTRQERLNVVTLVNPVVIPPEQMPNFLRLLNLERRNLHLPPVSR